MTHLSLKDQKRFDSLNNRRAKLLKTHFAAVKFQKELIPDSVYGK
jgi:hypothetical protein